MTETEFRNKVTWITFIFSYIVVIIHTNNIELFLSSGENPVLGEFVWKLESTLSIAMPTLAVPGFFLISAYLFYRDLTWNGIPQKMFRRVRSVLLPYITWNTLYYLGNYIASRFPALQEFIGEKEMKFTMEALADASLNFTYNPVLWYLKQLIIVIALAPILYLVLSKAWIGAVYLLALLTIISKGAIIPILNLDALLYYSTGAWLALHAGKLVEKRDRGEPGFILMKIAIAAVGAFLSIWLFNGVLTTGSVLKTVLYALTAPITVWIALPSGNLPQAYSWMQYSFFLYAFHFLIVRGINKAAAMILAHRPETALLLYLLIPVIAVVISRLAAEILRKKIPPLWSLLSGGR